MPDVVQPVAIPEIEAARTRLADLSMVTPLVACGAAPTAAGA